jgi:hypothetical protein
LGHLFISNHRNSCFYRKATKAASTGLLYCWQLLLHYQHHFAARIFQTGTDHKTNGIDNIDNDLPAHVNHIELFFFACQKPPAQCNGSVRCHTACLDRKPAKQTGTGIQYTFLQERAFYYQQHVVVLYGFFFFPEYYLPAPVAIGVQ